MLRSLLLLCWAATIVSAGDLKNVINNTNVPINLADDNVTTNSQLPLETTKFVSSTGKDVYVPSTLPESNTNVPVKVTLTAPNENVLSNDSTIIAPSIVITPTTITSPTTKQIPTTPPTTTSTSKSTTTPVPSTPLPPPSNGKWKVQENNISCIVVQMAAQFNVSYTDANNETINKAMDIPINSNATGKCDKFEQILTLSWGSQNNSALTAQNNFTLHFVKNETGKLYSLHHLEISFVVNKSSTDKLNETVVHMAPQFNTGLSNSYRCLKEQTLNLTLNGKNETVGQLKISNLQFQAFRNDNTTVFGLAKDCSYDTPDIVPITVGCALAGLVVVVLIAYLVGRRRSQSRGYLSM